MTFIKTFQKMLRHLNIITVVIFMLLPGVGTLSITAAQKFDNGIRMIDTPILRNKTPLCVLRDAKGFLWVGTLTGLACFDGNGESIYPGASGVIPGTEGIGVNSLFENGDDIWFGGNKGLYIFSRKDNKMEPFPFKTKYGIRISAPVNRIRRASDGKIWILTHGQGLFIYDPITHQLTQNSKDGAFFSDILTDIDGLVYCVTHDGHIVVFNNSGKSIRKIRLPNFATDKNPISMAYFDGKIKVAANTTLYSHTPGADNVEIDVADTKSGVINSLIAGKDDHLWIAADKGIFAYSRPKIESIAPRNINNLTPVGMDSTPFDPRVVELKEDTDGGLIVVSRTGISFVPPHSSAVSRVTKTDGAIYRTTVNAVAHSEDGSHIWLGTDYGVEAFDIATGKVTSERLPIGEDILVSSLAVDKNQIWIGTRHQGLYRYDLSSKTIKKFIYDENIPYSLISNSINDVFVTSSGEIFILTNWGLCQYDRENENFLMLAETGNGLPFLQMEEDAYGGLWTFTSTNDLFYRRHKNDNFRPVRSSALANMGISLLYKDLQNNLWAIAGGNRLMRFDPDVNDFIYVATPVQGDYPITFLEDDGSGRLWFSTDEGIARFDPENNQTDITVLTDNDILSVHDASILLPDGSVLFGSFKGLCLLSPQLLATENRRRLAYPVFLSFPFVENNELELKDLGVDKLLYTTDEIRLPFSHNTFTIHFAAISGSNSPKVHFQYKLEGVDKSWISTSGNEVTFSRLSPGRYKLLLRADSSADSSVSVLKIRISPPWYLSWPAFISYALIIAVIAWLLYRFAGKRVRLQTENKIRSLQAQQEKENYESKMRFFVNLVHEIRTPLTLINLPLEQLAEDSDGHRVSTKERRSLISSMQRNLDYLLGIINQLLDFRKAEQDSEVNLARKPINLPNDIKDICSRFEKPMASQGKNLILKIENGPITVMADSGKLDRVIMNLLGNALKYSRHTVTVSLKKSEDKAILTISDDGPGIPEKNRQHIFDTYYQIAGDEIGASLGTGLGLAYARLIARAHGGDITVGDSPEKGAEFRLMIPLAEAETETSMAEIGQPVTNEAVEITESASENEIRPTLLFAEDNDELRGSVEERLSANYNVIAVENGKSALDIIRTNNDIDLIISDFMMPEMDGAELCRKVKSDAATSFIPFIMLTAKTGREAKEEAMVAGADAFVEKPFSFRQLDAQISNIFKTRRLFYDKMKREPEVSKTMASEAPFINKIDADFLQGLNQQITDNISNEDFSIDTMADTMNMSRSSFYRRIKAITGMTPVDYLKNIRLDHAARMLDEGFRVTEVASSVGFTSSSYFAKCFKTKFGMIPKDYASRNSK